MFEFLRKFMNHGIQIFRVNSIRITKYINLLSFCTVLEVRCDVDIFKLTASDKSINIEAILDWSWLKLLHNFAKLSSWLKIMWILSNYLNMFTYQIWIKYK